MTAAGAADVPPGRKAFSTGTLLVIAFGLVILVGWFVYRPFIPPAWMHSFASDIALRASVEPDAPLPDDVDVREVTPRGLAASPYICAARAIDLPWDRLVIVGTGQDPRARDVLRNAAWGDKSLDEVSDTLGRDARYQLIVLLKDNAVIDAQMFYTFWADLSGIARAEGFAPAEAVFTAASKDRVYVVSLAPEIPPNACP
jgi:hypothetical protein